MFHCSILYVCHVYCHIADLAHVDTLNTVTVMRLLHIEHSLVCMNLVIQLWDFFYLLMLGFFVMNRLLATFEVDSENQ